jgi:hypothetical protein
VPSTPDPIVATTRDGRVVTIHPETGAELDELATANDLASGASFAEHRGTLARAAGGDVYVEVEILAGSGEPASWIYRLPAGGGAAELVVEGFAPAISPDGSTLAYARGVYESEVVLRELASGEERVIAARTEPPGEEFPDPIAALRFSPDGGRLAVTWSYEGSMLAIVDVGATSLHDAEQLFAAEPGCLSLGEWLGLGRLAAAVETSFPYCSNASEEIAGTGRVAFFEDDEEQTAASIALPTFARSLAADGESIAVVTFDDRLVRFDGGAAAPVALGDGFTQIIW